MEKVTTQKVTEVTKYKASDGRIFDNEWDCKHYEQDLTLKASEQLIKEVSWVDAGNPYDSQAEDYGAACYYVKNKEEYDAMIRCWFQDNPDDGEDFFIPKPEFDHWTFPLWVYICGRGDYGYYTTRAEDYINGTKEHIRKLENMIAQAGIGETI